MSTIFALILLADLAGGQTPSGYADSTVGSSELLDNMTAAHGTSETVIEVLDFVEADRSCGMLLGLAVPLHG